MPDRTPERTLGNHLEDIEAKFDRLDNRQKWRNRFLVAAVVVLAGGVGWVRQGQIDRDNATKDRIQSSCVQQNRGFDDYTGGLVGASGQRRDDPAVAERLKAIPVRDCTEGGTTDWFDNAPPVQTCEEQGRVSDGQGRCVTPPTTAVQP